MPIFFTIILWALGLILVICGLLAVIGFWVIGVGEEEFADWREKKWKAKQQLIVDSTQRTAKATMPNYHFQSLLVGIGISFGWIVLLALAIQVIDWVY